MILDIQLLFQVTTDFTCVVILLVIIFRTDAPLRLLINRGVPKEIALLIRTLKRLFPDFQLKRYWGLMKFPHNRKI